MFTTLIKVEDLLHLTPRPIIFDCRFSLADTTAGFKDYEKGHIAGAKYLDLENDLSGIKKGKNGRHPLPDPARLIATLKHYGVSNTSQVVAYDAQGGMFAARLWWLLRWLGHNAVAVLDGGWPAWEAAKAPISTASHAASAIAKGDFSGKPDFLPTVDADDILANIEHHDFEIIDARAPDRFRGENETLDPVGGHIPGAQNRFFKENLNAEGYFKPKEALRIEWLNLLGSTRPHAAVHQCGSGVTACHNLLALEVAGLTGGALYPGSWSEWCSDTTRPVEK